MKIKINDFPMIGKSGKRDNLEKLFQLFAQILPAGVVTEAAIVHEDECLCGQGKAPMGECTCETLDLTLSPAPEAPSPPRGSNGI